MAPDSRGVSFVGGGGGVRGLVELIQSYVEARVERCISRGYALLYGDWVCVVSLLAVREMARYGMCRSERECLESALSHLKTTRGCN